MCATATIMCWTCLSCMTIAMLSQSQTLTYCSGTWFFKQTLIWVLHLVNTMLNSAFIQLVVLCGASYIGGSDVASSIVLASTTVPFTFKPMHALKHCKKQSDATACPKALQRTIWCYYMHSSIARKEVCYKCWYSNRVLHTCHKSIICCGAIPTMWPVLMISSIWCTVNVNLLLDVMAHVR